jgi:hypothetical protein
LAGNTSAVQNPTHLIIVILLPLPLLRLLRSGCSQVARPQRSSLAGQVRQAAAHRLELLHHQVLQEVAVQPALLLLLGAGRCCRRAGLQKAAAAWRQAGIKPDKMC